MSISERDAQFGLNTPFGRIAVHHLLTSDPENPLLVLSCNSTTIVLKGGFWEHTMFDVSKGTTALPLPKHARFCDSPRGDGVVLMRCWRGPGSILRREAKLQCRRELKDGKTAWMLAFYRLVPGKS